MDIRTALKNNPTQGTKPQITTTPPEVRSQLTPRDEVGIGEENYGGNLIISEYMKFLTENGITEEDIRSVTETIITTGRVEWADDILGGKVKVRFKMRSGWLEDVVAKHVDTMFTDKNTSMGRFTGAIRMLNVAASLTHYNGRDLKVTNEDEFVEQYKFVQSLPYPILVAIGNRLAIFDRAVAVAMSDWALENFTEPQKENS